jgi:transcriptional regulator NrdR family protein
MKCPECGLVAVVIETRKASSFKRRRYECDNLHRFTTHETVVSPPKNTKALMAALKSAAKQMSRQ